MALNHTHTGPSASGNPRHDTENGRKKTQLGGRSDNTVLNRESRWKQRRTHEHRGTEGRQFGRFADTMLKDVRVLPWHANWHTFTDVCCCNNNRKGEVGRSLWTLSSTTKKNKQTNEIKTRYRQEEHRNHDSAGLQRTDPEKSPSPCRRNVPSRVESSLRIGKI